jgi:hypothetical protein
MAGAANGTMFSNEPCRVRKYSARLTRLNSNERAVCFVSIGTPLEVWRRLRPSALGPSTQPFLAIQGQQAHHGHVAKLRKRNLQETSWPYRTLNHAMSSMSGR